MRNYEISSWTSTHRWHTFEQYVESNYNLSLQQNKHLFLRKDGSVGYMDGHNASLIPGRKYFLGKQYIPPTDIYRTRPQKRWGVYEFAGAKKWWVHGSNKDVDMLVFKDKNGSFFGVYCGSMIRNRDSMYEDHMMHGFKVPDNVVEEWPEMAWTREDVKEMRRQKEREEIRERNEYYKQIKKERWEREGWKWTIRAKIDFVIPILLFLALFNIWMRSWHITPGDFDFWFFFIVFFLITVVVSNLFVVDRIMKGKYKEDKQK